MHTRGVFVGRGRPRRDHRDLPLPRLGVRREKRRGASGSRSGACRNLRNARGGWDVGGWGGVGVVGGRVGAGGVGGGGYFWGRGFFVAGGDGGVIAIVSC